MSRGFKDTETSYWQFFTAENPGQNIQQKVKKKNQANLEQRRKL